MFVTKKISLKLAVSVISLFALGAQSALAVIPTWDNALSGPAPIISTSLGGLIGATGWFQSKEYFLSTIGLDSILSSIVGISWDGITNLAMRSVMDALRQHALEWIKGGWSGNSPLFIEDPIQFFGQFADIGAGQFLGDIEDIFRNGNEDVFGKIFCEEFAFDVYELFPRRETSDAFDLSGIEEFKLNARCSIDDLGSFYNDFSDGGWNKWGEMRLMRNNPYGFMILALQQSEAEVQETVNSRILESLWGDGFLPVQGDDDCETDEDGECVRYRTKTPAQTVANRTDQVTNTDLEQTMLADELTELIYAVVIQIVQDSIERGLN